MNKRTMNDLKYFQSMPLDVKKGLTKNRIRKWVNQYGTNGVYISFSGGKDSTVLLDIVRSMYPNIPAVFVDVPTQYPELKEFATSFDNVTVLKPKISFAAVCEKYGFPLISKEVSECVQGARKYLTSLLNNGTLTQTDRQTDRPYRYWYDRVTGTGKYQKARIPSVDNASLINPTRGGTIENTVELEELESLLEKQTKKARSGSLRRTAMIMGMLTKNCEIKANIPSEDRSMFSMEKYKFFLEAPFEISSKCCDVMKKKPIKQYAKETGRQPITAQMAEESRLRTQKWLQHGCNAFDSKNPISNPMSFWTEQDVLQYIKEKNLPICSVYGSVVEDYDKTDIIPGQTTLPGYEDDMPLKTTGCSRTGCMLCGFGCHLEKSPNRFEMLKETHPGMYTLLDKVKNNGYTMREAIEWINEHGNMEIKT